MQLGVVFPQTEIGADPAGVRAYAQAIYELGYRHVLAYDHVLGADPAQHQGFDGVYNKDSLFHEVMVLFGYLAAAVPGLELVTGVLILPQRQAPLVAKQAAELDVLTGGRVRIGVGIGWNAVEYEALGANFRNRARRFEEQIALMRRLWTEPVLTFAGQYHTVTAAGLNPLPLRRPIPLWIGANAEPALKRASEIGDGFFPQRSLQGGWPATLERMRAWREAAGRPWAGYGIDARVNAGAAPPEAAAAAADEWRALGATHLSINTMGSGLHGPDAHIERLRTLRSALGS